MSGTTGQTFTELDAERRAMGRHHTAQLLKMLRGGYGTAPPPESAPEAGEEPIQPEEAALLPVRLLETPDGPTEPPLAGNPPRASGPVIATVGEGLRQASEKLSQLIKRVDALAESSRIFQAYLPPDLRAHVLLIRMDADAWTVQTGSGVWATRLRYVLYDIRDVLGLHIGIALPKPHIQITPVVAAPAPTRTRTLTRQAARCLEETARNETDPRLSAALMRLAGRAGP